MTDVSSSLLLVALCGARTADNTLVGGHIPSKTLKKWAFWIRFGTKTGKNRKKPVETKEIGLTKRLKRLKVNCGTVLSDPREH
jgi:hypothetical protein